MRLKGRAAVATVKLMRRMAEAAAVPPEGIRLLFSGDCAPALIPLVQPGKGREARSAAERPYGLLSY
jgi:hypothetical protein